MTSSTPPGSNPNFNVTTRQVARLLRRGIIGWWLLHTQTHALPCSANIKGGCLVLPIECSALFDRIHNHTLKGAYHDTLGNALEDLSVLKKRAGYVDRALIEYAAARYHFEQAEHRSYLACVENNLGMLYFRINQYDERTRALRPRAAHFRRTQRR